ncbi:DUF1614 domain-containing protein, partial [Thermofilum sp.]|uniref:DUF1614 domain-containing protein n=1 Tax=Thermofilum sp. TaxID=1961369 RepID=UPI0031629DF6
HTSFHPTINSNVSNLHSALQRTHHSGLLIGAEITNLHKIPKLEAKIASIGGAGTFDGIFLSGIIATLLV